MVIVTTTVAVSKQKAEQPAMHVYFFHRDESIAENFVWRYDRPVQYYFELLPAILRDAGMPVTDAEAKEPRGLGEWDQYAGCSCGCSPGIILRRFGPSDLYVTIASRVEFAEAPAEDTSADKSRQQTERTDSADARARGATTEDP